MAKYADLVYGSLAYDPFGAATPALDPSAYPEQLPQQEPTARPAAAPRERVSIRTRAEARAEAKQGIPLFAVLAIPVALLCLYLLLQSYISLTALSSEAARLEARVAQLQEAHNRLEIAYESAFDMAQVEQIAKTSLGMVKADSNQASYIRSRGGDRAEVLQTDTRASQPLAKLTSVFERLLSYLG